MKGTKVNSNVVYITHTVNCSDALTDVDECERDEDDCQPSQECINTEGSFTCQCPHGYRKVGTECIGKNQLNF